MKKHKIQLLQLKKPTTLHSHEDPGAIHRINPMQPPVYYVLAWDVEKQFKFTLCLIQNSGLKYSPEQGLEPVCPNFYGQVC